MSRRHTLIHKDQSALVLGAAVPQLSRVRALVVLRELIKQYLHQTFDLVEVDLTVLQKSKQTFLRAAHQQTDDPTGDIVNQSTKSLK